MSVGAADSAGSAVAGFWAWWPTVASRYAAVFDGGRENPAGGATAAACLTPDQIGSVLTEKVHAIDPGLVWEFGPGIEGARHCLMVTAGGVPELRPAARRWLNAAPAPDAAWSFVDMRLAQPGAVLEWEGLSYGPADCRIGVRAGHSIVHVTLWHPNWGSAKTSALRSGLFGGRGAAAGTAPDMQVAFLMLDAALGEEAVSTWLGQIEVTDRCPENAVSMDELRSLVAGMAAEAVDPDGNPVWTVLRFESDGAPGVVRTIVPATPMLAPTCDRRVEVELHIDPLAASDLTGAQVLDRVTALEDALDSTVSENSAGLLVAVVTHGGTVTMHLYLDSGAGVPGAVGGVGGAGLSDPGHADAVVNTLRAVASTWDLGEVVFSSEQDPSWEAVRGFWV